MSTFFARLLFAATRLPYEGVRAKDLPALTRHDKARAIKKLIHRWLTVRLYGQHSLLRAEKSSKSVLFMYVGVNNIGDALMDLSGRCLIDKRKCRADVLLDPSLAHLFKDDGFFEQVYGSPDDVDFSKYDHIVLNNLNLRSLKFKAKHAKRTSFGSMLGYFFGFDYNHIELSFVAINRLLKLGHSVESVCANAKITYTPREALPAPLRTAIGAPLKLICIAIGGRESYRTYPLWPEVLVLLDQQPALTGTCVVLLGSENARQDEERIMNHHFKGIHVVSAVGQLSLAACASLIEKSDVFVGADGGLMHVAHATDTPTVVLFSSDVPPDLRITQSTRCLPLMQGYDVETISPPSVVAAMSLALQRHP